MGNKGETFLFVSGLFFLSGSVNSVVVVVVVSGLVRIVF